MGRMFSWMNILTSKTNSRELEKQMETIFRIVHSFRTYIEYPIPLGMGLSGTPLNESLMCLHEILPKFKKENKLQKVQCVILTDGEGAPLKVYKEVHRPWEEDSRICELWPTENSFFVIVRQEILTSWMAHMIIMPTLQPFYLTIFVID